MSHTPGRPGGGSEPGAKSAGSLFQSQRWAPSTPACVSSHPLTLMVSSSMRRRLFSDSRSLFLVSICCSCVSNSASYSRLPSWNSRSSSCVFSALQNSQMLADHLLSAYMLLLYMYQLFIQLPFEAETVIVLIIQMRR